MRNLLNLAARGREHQEAVAGYGTEVPTVRQPNRPRHALNLG
jgi:hypothetical protein